MYYVPAVTNKVGKHATFVTLITKHEYVDSNGGESYWETSLTPAKTWSDKSPTVKTVVGYAHGFPWRPATNYGRLIMSFTYSPGRRIDHQYYPGGAQSWTTVTGYNFGGANPLDMNHPLIAFEQGIIDTDEHRKAIVECALRLNKQKVSIGNFLVEVHKSANLLADTAADFARLLLNLKKGRLSGLPKDLGAFLDSAGNGWLKWHYGWKPLASDLYEMYKLTNDLSKQPLSLTARRYVYSPYEFRKEYGGIPFDFKFSHRDGCQLTAVIKQEIIAAAQQIDIINPASLAWEVVPFSFVVDWFMPVGDYLKALSAFAGLEFVDGFHSQRVTGSITLNGNPGTAKMDFVKFNRVRFTDFPEVGFFAERKPIDGTKLVTILALFNQLR